MQCGTDEHCTHRGAEHVLTIGTCRVWAGGFKEVYGKLDTCQVALSLLGPGALAGLDRRREAKLIDRWLVWPNGGRPSVTRYYWETLERMLGGIQGDAVIFCLGGHGRTGTALAILASLAGLTDGGDPVAWVRQRYCLEAVESQAQIDYLRSLGIATDCAPSNPNGAYSRRRT